MLDVPAALIARVVELEARIRRRGASWSRRIDALEDRLDVWIVGALGVVFLEAAVGCGVVGWWRHAIAFGWCAVVAGAVWFLVWASARVVRPQE